MATYGWTPDYVRKGIPGAQGWVYANWAREQAVGLFGPNEVRKSDGYVKQEAKRICRMAKSKSS